MVVAAIDALTQPVVEPAGRDWALLRTCFVPDVVGHYGGDPLRGYEALEQLCRTTLTPLSASQHLIGNVLVTVDGNDVSSICYLQDRRLATLGGDAG